MANVEQSWEPGTLDKTRKNLGAGAMSEEERKRMAKLLGGEVKDEKSAPIDYKALPKNQVIARRATGRSANAGSQAAAQFSSASSAPEKPRFRMPELQPKERQLFDKLMMDSEYKLKTNYGVFNFVLRLTKSGDNLRPGFVDFTLTKCIDHLAEFLLSIKSINQIVPESYKEQIMTGEEDKFAFLRKVGSWSLKDVKYYQAQLQAHPDQVTVLASENFVRAVYRLLLQPFYLGENRVAELLKEIYADMTVITGANKRKVGQLCKTAVQEWFYVYTKLVKGLYPLLMRLCCNHVENFPDFFMSQTPAILGFLGITKYDLLLPNRKAKRKQEEPEEKQEEKPGEDKKDEEKKDEPQKENSYVDSGLKILEQLFPQAGFSNLSAAPDMFPYFHPLYQFYDGYNLLAPKNPLQVTITLLRITEDFMRGFRNIKFTDEIENFAGSENERFSTILGEWALYREVLFEKHYCDIIRDFVNQEYSQPGEFRKSQYGLKLTSEMLWQTKFYFLPHFEFQQLVLEKPKNDSPYTPLCLRTTTVRRILSKLARSIAQAEESRGIVLGVENPWDRYKFDIQTPVSKRLNVILGAKKPDGETKATNANLIKYALCVISVLDWWLNDKNSPAYADGNTTIYRISPKDGAPEFSAPLRSDQNDLFTRSIKAAIARKAEQGGEAAQTEQTAQPQPQG